MYSTRLFSSFILFAAGFTSLVGATPVADITTQISARDVWAPQITYPNEGDVFKCGQNITVTWDNYEEPSQVTNPIGEIVLGYENASFVDVPPLAENFSLFAYEQTVTLPVVQSGPYVIVLIGDSGDDSLGFEITCE